MKVRSEHRKRRPVSVRRARILPLLGFRFSTSRDAYILRVIGNTVGPVYQLEASPRPPLTRLSGGAAAKAVHGADAWLPTER